MKEIDKTGDELTFDAQFSFNQDYYLKSLDFLNWYRYFFIIKEVIDRKSGDILEVGTGNGMVKNCLAPLVSSYRTLDINEKLGVDIVADVRVAQEEIIEKFDCAIIADVLEHLPFKDLGLTLKNICSYLRPGGVLLATIPHRQSNFLYMTPTQVPHVVTVPTGFLSPGAFYRRFIKRKIWIDPHHCWEIGDGKVKVRDVETVMKGAGFDIESFQKLLYVDYWVLRKK